MVYICYFTEIIRANIIELSKGGHKFIPDVVHLMNKTIKREPVSQQELQVVQYHINTTLYDAQKQDTVDKDEDQDDTVADNLESDGPESYSNTDSRTVSVNNIIFQIELYFQKFNFFCPESNCYCVLL